MSLEEIKNALNDKPELLEKIVGLINEEKSRGIEEKSKANREAANFRKFKKAVESIGYTDDNDLDSFISELKSKINETQKSESLSMKALNTKIQELTDQINKERMVAKTAKIQSKLNEALADKVYGHQYLVKTLIADGKVDMDNDNIVFKDGESVFDFSSGINKILESNKDIVKSKQNQGTGDKLNNHKDPNDLQSIIKSNDAQKIKENIGDIAKELGLKI